MPNRIGRATGCGSREGAWEGGGKSSTTDNISVMIGLGTSGRQAYGSSAILRGGWARGSLNISGIIKLDESQD